MELTALRLRDLGFGIRVALTCFLLIVASGYLAGLAYMVEHVAKKDDEPELTMRDLVATYAGSVKPAPLRVILDESEHRGYLDDEEYGILTGWLDSWSPEGETGGDPIALGYEADTDYPPVDVIDEKCLRCHTQGATEGGGIGREVPLETLTQVKRHAYSKILDPVTKEILLTSNHTHMLGIASFSLLACLLFLATGWPRAIRHGVVMLCFVGLAADFAGMWLARLSEAGIYLVLGGGALFGAMLGIAIAGSLLHMWLGRRRA